MFLIFRSCSTLFLCFSVLSKQIFSLSNPVIFNIHSNAFKTKNTDIKVARKLEISIYLSTKQTLTKTHTDAHTDIHTDTHRHTHTHTHAHINL